MKGVGKVLFLFLNVKVRKMAQLDQPQVIGNDEPKVVINYLPNI